MADPFGTADGGVPIPDAFKDQLIVPDQVVYYAIGKYPVDATTPEKIKALKETLSAAAMELIGFGVSIEDVEDALDEALDCAEREQRDLARIARG